MPEAPQSKPNDPSPAPDGDRSKLGIGLSMGIQLMAGVGLGLLVGYWLDGRYGWSPWGVLIGALIGLAGGMYLMIKEALRL